MDADLGGWDSGRAARDPDRSSRSCGKSCSTAAARRLSSLEPRSGPSGASRVARPVSFRGEAMLCRSERRPPREDSVCETGTTRSSHDSRGTARVVLHRDVFRWEPGRSRPARRPTRSDLARARSRRPPARSSRAGAAPRRQYHATSSWTRACTVGSKPFDSSSEQEDDSVEARRGVCGRRCCREHRLRRVGDRCRKRRQRVSAATRGDGVDVLHDTSD